MSHFQTWLVPNRVVYVTLTGELSTGDVAEAFYGSAEHIIESTDPPVHFLHNWVGLKKFPTSLSTVFRATRGSKAPIKKVGWIVAYGKHDKLFKFMGNTFFKLFNVNFRSFRTAEDAITFLCLQDDRLDETNILQAHADFGKSQTGTA